MFETTNQYIYNSMRTMIMKILNEDMKDIAITIKHNSSKSSKRNSHISTWKSRKCKHQSYGNVVYISTISIYIYMYIDFTCTYIPICLLSSNRPFPMGPSTHRSQDAKVTVSPQAVSTCFETTHFLLLTPGVFCTYQDAWIGVVQTNGYTPKHKEK